MKKSKFHQIRHDDIGGLYDGSEEKTISPYVSSADIYKRYGKPGEKSKNSDDSATYYDAQGGPDADLWNKGSENFKERRRASRRKKGDERWIEAQSEETEPRRERSKRNKNVGSEPGSRGDSVGLRVIGGRLRGTKLEYGGDRRVRPMKERVREAIFNLLGEAAKGKHVVDLFTGTGALAFEAISRGAASATLFEIHFPTARVTKRNIQLLESKEPGVAARISLAMTDVYFWGRKYASIDPTREVKLNPAESHTMATLPLDVPWLVFVSPPYDFWVDREEETLALLRVLRDRAPKGSVFVIEADDRFDFDLLDANIAPKKRRSYPPAEVGIFTVE